MSMHNRVAVHHLDAMMLYSRAFHFIDNDDVSDWWILGHFERVV